MDPDEEALWSTFIERSEAAGGDFDKLDIDTDWDGILQEDLGFNRIQTGTLLKLIKAKKDTDDPMADCFFGKHAVDMTVGGVLDYLSSLQFRRHLRLSFTVHSATDLGFALCGREDVVAVAVGALGRRREAFTASPRPPDRTKYETPVFSGMKGLGKTRMLEEWEMLCNQAEIPNPRIGVIVMYGNGQTPQLFEDRMAIEAAFSWCMLHSLFVEDNFKDQGTCYWGNPDFLPLNSGQLTLPLAFRVVRAAAERWDNAPVASGQTLSLFLGIDEYQKIPLGPHYDPGADDQQSECEKTFLWQLIAALGRCRHAVKDIDIYPAFAGTKWGPLSIAGSSVPQATRAPLRLLSPQEIMDVIRSQVQYSPLLIRSDFKRQLFFLGGIPRPSIELALRFSNDPDHAFSAVWEMFVKRQWSGHLTASDRLRLVAFAVSGVQVEDSGKSGVADYS